MIRGLSPLSAKMAGIQCILICSPSGKMARKRCFFRRHIQETMLPGSSTFRKHGIGNKVSLTKVRNFNKTLKNNLFQFYSGQFTTKWALVLGSYRNRYTTYITQKFSASTFEWIYIQNKHSITYKARTNFNLLLSFSYKTTDIATISY